MKNTTKEKNVSHSVLENTFFPLSNEILHSRIEIRQVQNNYLQNLLKQQAKIDFTVEYTYFYSPPCTYVCSVSGCSGYRCMALAHYESSCRFPAVCSRLNRLGNCMYRCLVQDRTPKFLVIYTKAVQLL